MMQTASEQAQADCQRRSRRQVQKHRAADTALILHSQRLHGLSISLWVSCGNITPWAVDV
jgi:hypothetical protein